MDPDHPFRHELCDHQSQGSENCAGDDEKRGEDEEGRVVISGQRQVERVEDVGQVHSTGVVGEGHCGGGVTKGLKNKMKRN